MSKKPLFISLFLLVAVIMVLILVPLDAVKQGIRQHLTSLDLARYWIHDHFGVMLTFSLIQNVMHVPFFAVLAFVLVKYLGKMGRPFFRTAFLAALCVFAFSVASEAMQFFIHGRDASLSDLALDMVGCALGIVAYRVGANGERRTANGERRKA